MGLLDDAIREHLDLKRRRGGDPAEIEKLEREALGPVRRDPTAFADAGPATAGSAGLADLPAVDDDAPAAYAEAPVDAAALEDFALHPDDFAATELHAPVGDTHTGTHADAHEAAAHEAAPHEAAPPEAHWFEQKPPKDFDLD